MAAGLQALEVLGGLQFEVAEEELIVSGDPVAHQHLGTQLIFQHFKMGLVVGPESPDVLHCQSWELAAAVDLGHSQCAVSEQGGGVSPGEAKFRERCDVNGYLSFGPPFNVGYEERPLMLAPEQLTVDAGVLQFDILPGGRKGRRVGEVGSFYQLPVVVGFKHPPDVFKGIQRHLAVVVA